MASQFKCNCCDKIYQTEHEVLVCCVDIADLSHEPIEVYKAIFSPLWQTAAPDGVIPEFIVEQAENRFKIRLPFKINPLALHHAMIIAVEYSPLLEITADSIVLDFFLLPDDWITHNCKILFQILQTKHYSSLLSMSDDTLPYLPFCKSCIENFNTFDPFLTNNIQLDVKAIHFDVFQGKYWVTDQEDHTVIMVDYTNHTLIGPDSVSMLFIPDQIEKVTRSGR